MGAGPSATPDPARMSMIARRGSRAALPKGGTEDNIKTRQNEMRDQLGMLLGAMGPEYYCEREHICANDILQRTTYWHICQGLVELGIKNPTHQRALCRAVILTRDRLHLLDIYEANGGEKWKASNGWGSIELSQWWGITVADQQTWQGDGVVTEVKLPGNFVCGSLSLALARLPALTRLCLQSNPISGPIPDEIGTLTNLRSLNLAWTNLIGGIPWSLGNLSMLESLLLNDCRLTGCVPSSLGKLEMLTTLDLSNNNLGGMIPPELANCENLRFLGLQENNFSGYVPAAISGMKNCAVLLTDNPQLRRKTSKGRRSISAKPIYPFRLISAMQVLSWSQLKPCSELQAVLLDYDREATMESLGQKCRKRGSTSEAEDGQVEDKIVVRHSKQSRMKEISLHSISFISHRWRSPHHPDDEHNVVLRHLKALLNHHTNIQYVWLDYCCIPLRNTSAEPDLVLAAAHSIGFYLAQSTSFFALCTDRSDFDHYQKRAWCMLEMMLASLPRSKTDQLDGIIGCQLLSLWNNGNREEEDLAGKAGDVLKSPLLGELSVPADFAAIAQILQSRLRLLLGDGLLPSEHASPALDALDKALEEGKRGSWDGALSRPLGKGGITGKDEALQAVLGKYKRKGSQVLYQDPEGEATTAAVG
ncbi:unnamed protein product [Chrysoparadoxa australica]